MFESVLNPVLSPLLYLPPLVSILIISTVISLFITLIYKFTTDQAKMKSLREKLKEHQKELKESRNNPQKAMEIQKRAMESNMEYMKESFKATLYTFIPIIIIFGWLNAHMLYNPLQPGQEFTTTALFKQGITGTVGLEVPSELELLSNKSQSIVNGMASWTLKGPEGTYILDYKYDNMTYSMDLLITTRKEYTPVQKPITDGKLQMLRLNNDKIIYLNLLGWKIGWLGTYIIFSIILSNILRKILKVH